MAGRKTVDVASVKTLVNDALAMEDRTEDEARALCFVLENVLMETGNYNGYSELPENTNVSPSPCRGRNYY